LFRFKARICQYHAVYLFQSGVTFSHEIKAIAEQGFHSCFKRQLADKISGCAFGDRCGQGFIHAQHFVHTDTALVTGALTVGARSFWSFVVSGFEKGDIAFIARHEAKAT
jgi:hypothetical protein